MSAFVIRTFQEELGVTSSELNVEVRRQKAERVNPAGGLFCGGG